MKSQLIWIAFLFVVRFSSVALAAGSSSLASPSRYYCSVVYTCPPATPAVSGAARIFFNVLLSSPPSFNGEIMKTTGPFVTDKSLQKGATYSLETTFTVEGEPPYSLELELKAGMCTYIDECVPPGQAVTEEKGGETLYDGVIDGD